MQEDPVLCLEALKEQLQQTALKRLGIDKAFADYSGQDISLFQEDLQAQCQSSISEKWFYTHLKNKQAKLPRVDVLHLLSRYCGHANWETFCKEFASKKPTARASLSKVWIMSAIAPALAVLVYFIWPKEHKVYLQFVDAYTQKEIPFNELSLINASDKDLAQGLQQAEALFGDSLIVKGAYYKERKIAVANSDTMLINLYPDDYALMLNYFSRSDVKDLKKRQRQLKQAIHPDARIFQSHPQFQGIELLNREEFIERLLLPIDPLQNLEIQDIVYRDSAIYRLRFVQKMTDHE